MNLKYAKETNVFVVVPNNKYDDFNIEEISLFEHIMASVDETTSPRGVEGRIHIREIDGSVYRLLGTDTLINEYDYDNLLESELTFYEYYSETTIAWELWSWGVNGNHPKKIETFENEEDVEQAWFDTIVWDFEKDDQRITTYSFDYDNAVMEIADIWGKPFECVKSYLEHKAQADAIRSQRNVKQQLEYEQKRLAQSKLIREEANTIIIDEQFKVDVKNVYNNLLIGENKSKGLSIAFNALLKRNNIEKITSDYWQVFRIINSKI